MTWPATAAAATARAAGSAGASPSDATRRGVHTISLLTRDRPGVLVRVALIFSRRGYNIESLVVSADATSGDASRMTITCSGDPDTLEQIIKQLAKLVDVIHAIDHTGQRAIEAEIGLIKLRCGLKERTEILQIAEHYKAKVVDYGPDSVILRVYGDSQKIDNLIQLLAPFATVELVRSGKVLMARGLEET